MQSWGDNEKSECTQSLKTEMFLIFMLENVYQKSLGCPMSNSTPKSPESWYGRVNVYRKSNSFTSLPQLLSDSLFGCFIYCSLTNLSSAKYILAIILKINQCKMDRFYGSWKFVSCDNFDDYLKGEINQTLLLTDLFNCWWWSQGRWWYWSIIDGDGLECDFDCDG